MLRIFYYIITVKSQILISSFEKQKKTRGKIWFAKKFHNYVHAGTSSLDADFSSWFANNSFHYKSILWYMLVLLIYILQCLVQASACNSCYLYMYIYIYTIYTGNSLFIYMLVFCNFLSNGFFYYITTPGQLFSS